MWISDYTGKGRTNILLNTCQRFLFFCPSDRVTSSTKCLFFRRSRIIPDAELLADVAQQVSISHVVLGRHSKVSASLLAWIGWSDANWMVLATAWIKAAVSPGELCHHHGLSASLKIIARQTGRTGTMSDQQASTDTECRGRCWNVSVHRWRTGLLRKPFFPECRFVSALVSIFAPHR